MRKVWQFTPPEVCPYKTRIGGQSHGRGERAGKLLKFYQRRGERAQKGAHWHTYMASSSKILQRADACTVRCLLHCSAHLHHQHWHSATCSPPHRMLATARPTMLANASQRHSFTSCTECSPTLGPHCSPTLGSQCSPRLGSQKTVSQSICALSAARPLSISASERVMIMIMYNFTNYTLTCLQLKQPFTFSCITSTPDPLTKSM